MVSNIKSKVVQSIKNKKLNLFGLFLLIAFFIKGLPQALGLEKVLLLDDVLSYLDSQARKEFFYLLEKKDYQVFISDINKVEIDSLDVNFVDLK